MDWRHFRRLSQRPRTDFVKLHEPGLGPNRGCCNWLAIWADMVAAKLTPSRIHKARGQTARR